MPDPQARFEFRIWGSHLDAAHQRLDALAAASDPRESAETYILSRLTDTANVKIRDNLLDIKLLVEQQGRLERWRPVLKTGFPLDSRTLVEVCFPNLRVAPPALERSAYTHGELIQDVVRSIRDLATVNVAKKRYGYKLERCTAEFAIVEIDGGNVSETVQVEAEDPVAALGAIVQLGLSAQPNVNYIRHLKTMIGMSPAPESTT